MAIPKDRCGAHLRTGVYLRGHDCLAARCSIWRAMNVGHGEAMEKWLKPFVRFVGLLSEETLSQGAFLRLV